MRAFLHFFFAAAWTIAACAANAQTLPQEYRNLVRAENNVGSLDASLLGDRIDYYTGHIEFAATDVSLPGNHALPVAVGRRYAVQANPSGVVPERAFGDWDIEVPHIEGIVATSVGWTVPGANPNARCSAFAGAPPASVTTPSISHAGQSVTTVIPWEQYSTGYRLAVPGYGRRELLQRAAANNEHPTSGTYPIVTNDWWMVSCLSALDVDSPGQGEGFSAIAPDGTKYTFNWLATRPYVALSRPADTADPNVTATLDRSGAWMMATKVEDRFGNWVKYKYDPYKPLHLLQITSSDGRTVTVTYTGATNIVQSISDGSHSWSYGYTYNGSYYSLSSVTLPDASKWQISFDTLNHISWSYSDPWTCGSPGTPSVPNSFNGTITHPGGAQGKFTFNLARRGRNGAPSACYTNSVGVEFGSVQPSVYDTLALTEKRISGPALPTALVWALAYAGCSASCASTVTTTISDPRGYNTRYTFGTGYNDDEGLLTKKESGGSGASYLQTETYQYFAATGQSYPAQLGTSTQSRGDTARLATLRPLKQRSTVLQGVTFSYTAMSLDEFGFPQSITRAGSSTKSESVTYSNDKAKWVLGTVKKVVSGGLAELDLVLNALDQPTSVSRFGQVDQTFGYNTDGTLQWSKDGASHQITYSNWYRGVPRNVGYATGENESVAVSNTGTIDSWTDERGSITAYDHDAMRRLSGVHYPSGDPGTGGNQSFAATTIAWSTSAAGWASTETTDTYQKITKYDALLRPTLVNEGNARYVNQKYDGDGGPSFVSIPSTLPTEGSGTSLQYDGLGRVTAKNVVGYQTSYTYQSGFVTRVSDPNATTYTHYLTHDEPSMAWPITIDGPLYTTIVTRDPWGRPQSISRGSVKREWTWGGRFVCATYSPERGTTVLQRDGAGNVTASADIGPADAGCDYGAINSTNKVARTYDNRNRLLTVDYPGGTNLDIAQTWWPNSRLHTANRGGINRTYNTNRRGLLTFETIAIDGDPYQIDYAYNTRGQLATLTYPDASSVDYAPNAWGEPTKAGTFASGISYWPDGAVKGFAYGNGIAHTMTQDVRLQPQHVADGTVLDRDYGYDGVGNVTAITDHLGAHTDSVGMTYDTANRLQTANAAGLWGNASFTYDDTDNLKTSTVGGVLTTFTIDAATNRASAMIVGGSSTPLHYDAQGHLTQKGAQAFTFDRSDLLLGIAGFAAYRYDAEGRRTVIETNGESRTAIYDHEGRLLVELEPGLATGCNPANDRVFCNSFEKPPANVSQTRYVYLGRHLLGKDGAPGLHYLHTDALGSLVAETDASKVVTQRYRYEPYGRPFGAVADGPGYAGHVMDASGLIYMQARYYDPQIGRFLSTDPVDADSATGSNFNRYAYGDSNPFRFIDPDGGESRDFDWISKQEDVTPPPQSPDDWLGPALGVALGAVAAPVAAAAAVELGGAALANPETATAIVNGVMEAGAGEALGGASLAAGAASSVDALSELREQPTEGLSPSPEGHSQNTGQMRDQEIPCSPPREETLR